MVTAAFNFPSLLINRGSQSPSWLSAERLTGIFNLVSCEANQILFPVPPRSRNPKCLCLLWTGSLGACSFTPFLTLFLFCFSSTEMFMVGLRPAMCFECSLCDCYLSLLWLWSNAILPGFLPLFPSWQDKLYSLNSLHVIPLFIMFLCVPIKCRTSENALADIFRSLFTWPLPAIHMDLLWIPWIHLASSYTRL